MMRKNNGSISYFHLNIRLHIPDFKHDLIKKVTVLKSDPHRMAQHPGHFIEPLSPPFPVVDSVTIKGGPGFIDAYL